MNKLSYFTKPFPILVLSIFILFISCYYTIHPKPVEHDFFPEDNFHSKDTPDLNFKLCLPEIKTDDLIVEHPGFILSFNRNHMQANWVAYEINSQNTLGKVKRTNRFKPDTNIPEGTAGNEDYIRSGFDKGHLAPAADMSWSLESMNASFYFSNISPQLPGFNRGIWKNLEEQVRDWANHYGNIFLTTGPVLKDSLPFIGLKKVSIPEYFYKVILDTNGGNMKGIGFVMPNNSSDKPVQHFAVTIDSVELLTGIDFFASLSDSIATIVESTLCIECWVWQNGKLNLNEKSNSNGSVQCKGITKAGVRCKNMTSQTSGFCPHHMHQND